MATERIVPVWPATAALPKPGTSVFSMRRERLADQVAGLAPAGAEHEGDVVALHPGALADDGGGRLGDREGVGRGVGQVVGGGGVGHAAQRSEAGDRRSKP